MEKNEKLQLFLLVIIIAIGLGLYLYWINGRDETIMKAGSDYEQCVKEKFDTTPADYNARNGEYPKCETIKNK